MSPSKLELRKLSSGVPRLPKCSNKTVIFITELLKHFNNNLRLLCIARTFWRDKLFEVL